MMKKIFRIASAAFLMLFLLPAIPARAADPLDEIKSYVTTVDMRQDGTMDIKYHLDWLVLDDTSEGPLTWVKIGIPNSHADDIKALSSNISDIGYLSDDGSYVRVEFDRAYHAGETVSFDFSIHQSYMYTLGNNTCSYSFTPGWFDGITVDQLKVLWYKADVASSNATGAEGNYLLWETSLAPGERYEVKVVYPAGVFDTSESMQVQEEGGDVGRIILAIFIGIVLIGVILGRNNPYRGGFGRGGMYGHTHSCACACAGCACACACAGGGRAGCSAKNFYGAKVHLRTLYEKLKQIPNI